MKRKHYLKGTPEYGVWSLMRDRCNNKNNKSYGSYGGRGVRVCERWDSAENFVTDMGLRPSSEHTIERLNNEGDYEPDNCIWLVRKLQGENTRKTIRVVLKGEKMSLTAACRKLGQNYSSVYYRLKEAGQTVEQALGLEPSHRHEIMVRVGGIERNLKDTCKKLRLNYSTVTGRLRAGWTMKEALELM